MKVLVSTANNIEGHDPGPLGRRMTRLLIRDGDHSASGIAPIAMRDGTAGALAILGLRRASSPDIHKCPVTMPTCVPCEANVRMPRRVLRIKKHECPAHADVPGRTIWRADLASWVQPLPVSVDELRLYDASARDGAVRGRLLTLQMLPTGDSYFNC